jgi:hypothetical protein
MIVLNSFIALEWLRQHSNLEDEISELQDEQSHHEHTVNLICLSIIFLKEFAI